MSLSINPTGNLSFVFDIRSEQSLPEHLGRIRAVCFSWVLLCGLVLSPGTNCSLSEKHSCFRSLTSVPNLCAAKHHNPRVLLRAAPCCTGLLGISNASCLARRVSGRDLLCGDSGTDRGAGCDWVSADGPAPPWQPKASPLPLLSASVLGSPTWPWNAPLVCYPASQGSFEKV